MRIIVFAYLDNNLGDDLMIKTVAAEFPEHMLWVYSDKSIVSNTFSCLPNVVVRKRSSQKRDIWACDMVLSVGGSIFSDINTFFGKLRRLRKIRFILRCRILGKPVATLGCNLGPYTGRAGLLLTKLELSMNDLVTVRDRSSHSLVKGFRSVRNFHVRMILFTMHLSPAM